MEPVQMSLKSVKIFVNNRFGSREPWQIATITATSVLAGVWFWNFLFKNESIQNRVKKAFFKFIRKIPNVQKKIEEETSKVSEQFKMDVIKRTKSLPFLLKLENSSKNQDEIITLLKAYLNMGEYDWKNGYASGAVYNFNPDLIELLTKVYGLASYTNPLHGDLFPGICKMEAEVVRMTADIFHGGSNSGGTMTSGGTESILMACKAYRDYAKHHKNTDNPEMIIPTTAHAAFDKAGIYFRIKIHHVAIDPITTAVSLKEMKKVINKNTIMLVGSVPNYPYGTMDDIQGIAELGRRYNIPVHVDCCLGGFIAPFMKMAGFAFPSFDFSVPGVTSISADTHKYGFAPKGSSVVLYSDIKYRHFQYCVTSDWPGGVYGSPTINGSRAGGIIAACWATLLYFGLDGYVEATKRIVRTTRHIVSELRKFPEIFIFGQPVTTVVAVGSNKFPIFRLSQLLNERGWNLNALQFPSGIHLCVTYMHTLEGVADRFIQDVKSALEEISQNPGVEVEGKMAIYGMAQAIPDRTIVEDFTNLYLDSMYYTPSSNTNTELNGNKTA